MEATETPILDCLDRFFRCSSLKTIAEWTAELRSLNAPEWRIESFQDHARAM
jgi:hypothetical protein